MRDLIRGFLDIVGSPRLVKGPFVDQCRDIRRKSVHAVRILRVRSRRGIATVTTLLVIGLSAGCAGSISAAEKQQVELHGSASYRQRMMLPLDADFTAWLIPMEGEEPLAEMRLPQAGQPPIEFTLRLPSGAAGPARLRLEITGLDRLLFVFDQTVDTGAWAAAGHRKFLLEMPPQE